MKRTLLAAILATAAIAFSCTMEEPVKSDSMVFNPTATVTDFVLDGTTKTSFTIKDNEMTFAFEDEDILRIYPLNPVGDGLLFTVKENKGSSCVFDGGGFGLFGGLSYAAFYPGSDEVVPDATEIPVDYTGQSMMAKEAWDLSAVDYLVASIPAVEGACNFSMKHIGALVVLDVTFEEAGSYNELTLTSDGTPFITNGTIDLTADPIAVTGTEFAETISLTLGNADGISVEAGETVRFVMMIAPVDMSNSTIKMTLTNGYDEISTEFEGKNYQPGKAFKILGSPVGSEEPLGDIKAIDLGLPSGTLWANMNVGAHHPSDIGGRYAWGEVSTKSYYDWDNYKWCEGTYSSMTKYCTYSSYGAVDGKIKLDDEDDVAQVQWGNGWRMPTKADLKELVDYCTITSTSLNGVQGQLVTGPNSNTIFLPYNGQWDEGGLVHRSSVFLWASETEGDYYAILYRSGYIGNYNHKHDGLCVRPVKDGSKAVYLSANGTSNCYIVPSAGNYKIRADVKGNSSQALDGTPNNAVVVWETNNTDIAPEAGSIVHNVKYEDGFIFFESNGNNGNALVAVRDSEGEIIWSWHLWFTPYNPSEDYDLYSGSNIPVMNRNLGSLSNNPGEPTTIGFYYQWGRKDPFPSSSSVNSYSPIATCPSNVFSETQNTSSTGTIEYAIHHPTQTIGENPDHSVHDWLYYTNGDLWGSSKTIYDPCPAGWKVPEASLYSGFTSSGDYVRDSENHGIVFHASTPATFYPAAGTMSAGGLYVNEFAESCHYWTSSKISSTISKRFCVYSYSSPTTGFNSFRSHGFPIRCCKETEE